MNKTLKRQYSCTVAEIIGKFENKISTYLGHRCREKHQYQKITKMKGNLKKKTRDYCTRTL